MNLRTRTINPDCMVCNQEIFKWFRKTFNSIQYKNLQLVYFALCEIYSDFQEHPIRELSKTIQKYAGVSYRITIPVIYFLEELQLIEIEQQRINKKYSNSVLRLFEWNGQDEHYIKNKERLDKILLRNAPVIQGDV